MNKMRSLCMLALGTAVGLKFADLDQILPGLVHRSILTHSFFAAGLLWLWTLDAPPSANQARRWCTLGFGLACCVHLCFDLFPRAWKMHALIHIPFYGETSPLFSWLWIAGSAMMCAYMALLQTRARTELVPTLGVVLIAYAFAATSEPRIAVPALAMLTLTTGLAFALPRWFPHAE